MAPGEIDITGGDFPDFRLPTRAAVSTIIDGHATAAIQEID
jgi:hypothetical protein